MTLFSALCVSMAVVVVAASSGNLRKEDDPAAAATAAILKAQEEAESECNNAADRETCFGTLDETTGLACNWCDCAAVPSECLSPDQAKLVPPSIFDCKAPEDQDPAYWESQAFGFHSDQRHSLRITVPQVDLETYVLQDSSSPPEPAASDLCDASSKSLSGYMDISGSKYDANGENKHLFFWMFEKRNLKVTDDVSKIPLVIWLTGGPGCSSTLALLAENGPCSVNNDGATTTVNPYSWTEAAHVLWLDQPAGVGFSYGSETDSNEAMVSEDVYYFFQAFLKTYPRYASSPLYVIGESYAGHYVPAVAHRMWLGNKKAETDDKLLTINLSGIAIGNGLTKPEEQYKWYPEMMFNNSHGIKVIDETSYKSMKAMTPACTKLIHECNQGDNFLYQLACQSAFMMCNLALISPYQMTGLNPYDIRSKCGNPPLCYDFSHVARWLNSKTTMKALGVDPAHKHSWHSCNMGINLKFHTDWMKDFSGYVATLLNNDIPALIYAGDVDFICNYLGNRAWTLDLEWNGKDKFQAARQVEWNGAGLVRSAQGLTFFQVYDAGHMVPMNQPDRSLDMLIAFLTTGKVE